MPADFAVDAAIEEMRRRYDILYSRVDTLMTSPLYTAPLTSPRMEGMFQQVAQEIFNWAHTIDLPDPALMAALDTLQPQVAANRPRVRSVMTIGNQALVQDSDHARQDVATVLYRLAVVSFVLLVALSSLVVLSFRLAVLSARRAALVQATSARLSTIVDTSLDAIAVIDPRGTIESLNEAGQAMFGLSAQAATGERIGTILRRETADGTRSVSGHELTAACAEGRKRGYRLVGRSADGHSFPVELSMDVARRDDRALLVCMIRDVSHQAATEAELKDSRDRALAGERAKARFLGVISHEMRTPLNGILGTIELMGESDEDSRADLMPVLRNSANVLLGLVNDVLDVTQIEGGGAQLNLAPFDLDQLLDELIASEMPRAHARGNQLNRTAGAPVLGWAMGDRARLRQILLNLTSNAVKFTRNGQITVDAARVGQGQIEFQVWDTGVGMTAEDADRVFDDFVRLDSALREQVQGTGLGLGIARQLAQLMGGEIGVESEEGQGSLFWVRLPLPVARPQAAVQPATEAEAEDRAVPPLDILLVEDNATNRLVARKLLERDGHRVQEAHDGAEGVRLAGQRFYDLILMDVSMPVMDGTTATRLIRTGEGASRDTRIVALTAHIGETVAQELRGHGIDEVVSKPLRGQDLRRVLRGGHAQGCINATILAELWQATGPAKAAQLLRGYLDEGMQMQQEWSTLIASGEEIADLKPLAGRLHHFAGSSATFGATRLVGHLQQAETAALAGNRAALCPAIRQSLALWPATRDALSGWLAERESGAPPTGPLRRALP